MRDTTTEEALGRVAFFADLSRRDLRRLASLCVPKTFEPGDVILREGALGLGLYLICEGRVEVFRTENGRTENGRTENGRTENGRRRKLAELGSGDVLGEMALIDDKPRSASAEALEPTSALLLSRDSFRIVVKKSPAVAWAMVPELAERLREVEDRLVAAECRAEDAEARENEARESEKRESHIPESELPKNERRAARGQVTGALLAGLMKGANGPWRVFKSSSHAFSDALELDAHSTPTSLLTRLPRGAWAAATSSVMETGKVSREVASTFFEHLDSRREGGPTHE